MLLQGFTSRLLIKRPVATSVFSARSTPFLVTAGSSRIASLSCFHSMCKPRVPASGRLTSSGGVSRFLQATTMSLGAKESRFVQGPRCVESVRHYVRPNYFQDRPSLATRKAGKWSMLGGGGGGGGPLGNNPISRWLRFDTANKVVYTILGVNSVVFVAWLYAKENAARFGDRRLYVWMMKNFTNMERNIREGRVWTLVTSAFSHQRIEHFALNSIALVSFGQACWNILGTRQFMLLYLGAAVGSSALSVVYHKFIVRDSHRQYSLGASGALTGLATTFACVYPRAQFMLFFVIPVPAGILMGAFGLYEAYNLLNRHSGIFDSAGHLGGGLFGAAYYIHKVLPILRRTGRL